METDGKVYKIIPDHNRLDTGKPCEGNGEEIHVNLGQHTADCPKCRRQGLVLTEMVTARQNVVMV